MRYLVFLLVLFGCSKQEAPILPNLLQYDINTNAAKLYYDSPVGIVPTDTSIYFQSQVNMIVQETPTRTHLFCASKRFELNDTSLIITWKSGPLSGKTEKIIPVALVGEYTKVRSQFREFYLKSE